MSTTLEAAVAQYLRSGKPSQGTRAEYKTTIHKWSQWGGGGVLEELTRKDLREFLDWVYERAIADGGTNAGRTTNKAREQIRAVLSWAWDQEIIVTLPRFPSPKEQRDVAGRPGAVPKPCWPRAIVESCVLEGEKKSGVSC